MENSTLNCPERGKWVQVILRQWKIRLPYLFHKAFPPDSGAQIAPSSEPLKHHCLSYSGALVAVLPEATFNFFLGSMGYTFFFFFYQLTPCRGISKFKMGICFYN